MNQINTTRFLTQDELAAKLTELKLSENRYEAAGIPLLVKGDKVYVDTSDSHSIIFGATGSKKTRLLVMPTVELLYRAGESFVVTDPKGEIFERTAKHAKESGYSVSWLDLRNVAESLRWNPLELPYRYYHRGETAKAMELVTQLSSMIVGEAAEKDKFWADTSKNIISGFILLLMGFVDSAEECNILNLMELWETYLSDRKTFMRRVKDEENKMIFRKLSAMDISASSSTLASMEAYVSSSLNRITINADMMKLLSGNDVSIEKIVDEKAAVYLVIPDENPTYHFIASVFLTQLYDCLIGKAQVSKDNRLPIRMNFIVDEFANLPKIDNMDSMITAARSRNIRFILVVQSMQQLKYKYEAYADVICSNCNNWIYLYSKEYELLQKISHLCGEKIYDNNCRIPLISEFELQHLDKEAGEALVLACRNYPCIVNLKDIDAYEFDKV